MVLTIMASLLVQLPTSWKIDSPDLG
uniref:Uncharacterized protein n=1 Tax=Rhizophora mucronata TaxID=61149 RepID=A0A2P2NNX3_RHIMU